jgi:PD-(D/E)XK nuclease superfamily
MNAMIRSLAGFCRAHPLDEKVFVAPSFIAGRQIGEALARETGSWVNLRFVTLPSLAHEAAALELVRLGTRLVAGSELLVFADTLFRELKEGGRLEYFAGLQPSPGVARILLGAILRLRMEGLGSERIDPGLFSLAEKGRDIRVFAGHYESRLEAAGGIDLPGLYALAAKAARRAGVPGNSRFLCPADTALGRVEKDFLEAASGGGCVFVAGDPVHGLERPRLFETLRAETAAPSSDAGTDVERLPWLFDPRNAPKPFGDGSLEVFRAVGPMNECREVLRRILGKGLAFDQVELISPGGPIYTTALHHLSLRTGFAVTFADGLPLSLTSPGRVFSGLADWIEAGYPASSLGRLVESLDMRFPFQGPEEDVPPQTVSRHLREALIGWGRERYVECLRVRRMKLEAKLHDPRADEESGISDVKRNDMERETSEIDRLIGAVRIFLSFFPDVAAPGPVPFEGLSLGLATALERCAVLRPDPEERDRQALGLITAELRAMAGESWGGSPDGERTLPPLDLEASLDRLRTAVSSLSVGASAPRPGHLHVSSFSSGGFSGRPVTFVMGLDDADFPGHGFQDPVLLDDEREKLSPRLPTTADSLRERLYSMAALLSSLRGRVIFSFPAYDILEDRAAFPSSLILQLHRLLSGDGRRDYASLEEMLAAAADRAGRHDPAGFLPDAPDGSLDGTEWWLGRLAGGGRPLRGLAAVRRHFPALEAGIRAEEARAGDKLSEYEGVVRVDGRRYDPLSNPQLEVSASRLEGLVKCPFGYFLKYVLGIEPPEELELDRSRWLDPMDRGSLIHDILCEFMTRVVEKDDRPDPSRHGPLMEEVAGKAIASWKRKIPPPSEAIFEKERLDIHAALGVFFKVESVRPANIRPFVFEKAFEGIPIEVEGGRSFLLKGRIDRIDRTGQETFRILDYKTGSPRPFEDLKSFGKGRVIQHALYAVTVEKLLVKEGLARKPRVTESGYSFPTRRGEGREVLVPEFDRGAFRALLRDILALISKGYFVSALKDECGYCDFSPVCGGRPEETKRKIKANEEIFEAFERLKSYD